MALHSISNAAALPIAVSVIPSLSRRRLNRLVARAIDRRVVSNEEPVLEDDGTAESEGKE